MAPAARRRRSAPLRNRRRPIASALGAISSDQLVKAFEELRFPRRRGRGNKTSKLRHQCRLQATRLPEEAPCLFLGEAGERSCLVIGSDSIGAFDQFHDLERKLGGKAKADMDGRQQPLLKGFIVERQRRLEWADEVSDHIFGSVVDQRREAKAPLERNVKRAGDSLDNEAMLGDRKSVI